MGFHVSKVKKVTNGCFGIGREILNTDLNSFLMVPCFGGLVFRQDPFGSSIPLYNIFLVLGAHCSTR